MPDSHNCAVFCAQGRLTHKILQLSTAISGYPQEKGLPQTTLARTIFGIGGGTFYAL
jgi:hypothetical protein